MSTITTKQQTAIAAKLKDMHLPRGLGDAESACSIAAINLALTGELSDNIPDCMSPVIGQWIIHVQDAMPDAMRNSIQWKSLLPLAAGTGRAHEQERLEIILGWMWDTALPVLQPLADKQGFGSEWQHMCTQRAAEAAWAAKAAKAAATWDAATRAAGYAAGAADYAAVAASAAEAAGFAANAAAAAAAAAYADAWKALDPYSVLELLISKGEK